MLLNGNSLSSQLHDNVKKMPSMLPEQSLFRNKAPGASYLRLEKNAIYCEYINSPLTKSLTGFVGFLINRITNAAMTLDQCLDTFSFRAHFFFAFFFFYTGNCG